MKKVFVDSSVWVSYFRRDSNFDLAEAVLQRILRENMIIILPTIVYIEVINTLCRVRDHEKEVELAITFLSGNRMIHICHTTGGFWLNEIVSIIEKVNLRSHDLIIVAHALKFNAELVSFDKKMVMAYKKIRENKLKK